MDEHNEFIEASRKSFEEWAKQEGYRVNYYPDTLAHTGEKRYANRFTEEAWKAWLARDLLADKQLDKALDVILMADLHFDNNLPGLASEILKNHIERAGKEGLLDVCTYCAREFIPRTLDSLVRERKYPTKGKGPSV